MQLIQRNGATDICRRGTGQNWAWDVGFSGQVPAGLTFTRASNGGGFDANGVWSEAAANVARFDHNPQTGQLRGLLLEGQRTNLLLWNRDLTNAAWAKTGMAVAATATGIDNVGGSASTITASAANATVLQAVASASAGRATSAYVRRRTGSGTVEMTQNGGSTWSAITVAAGWRRVELATATVTNPSVGFRLRTSGDAIDVDLVQLESATFASSAIATTAAAATRGADLLSGNSMVMGFNQVEGAFYAEVEYVGLLSNATQRLMQVHDGSSSNRLTFSVGAALPESLAALVIEPPIPPLRVWA